MSFDSSTVAWQTIGYYYYRLRHSARYFRIVSVCWNCTHFAHLIWKFCWFFQHIYWCSETPTYFAQNYASIICQGLAWGAEPYYRACYRKIMSYVLEAIGWRPRRHDLYESTNRLVTGKRCREAGAWQWGTKDNSNTILFVRTTSVLNQLYNKYYSLSITQYSDGVETHLNVTRNIWMLETSINCMHLSTRESFKGWVRYFGDHRTYHLKVIAT